VCVTDTRLHVPKVRGDLRRDGGVWKGVGKVPRGEVAKFQVPDRALNGGYRSSSVTTSVVMRFIPGWDGSAWLAQTQASPTSVLTGGRGVRGAART